MIVESVQLLSTAARTAGIDKGYAITHMNHPCSKWARESMNNWLWLKQLAYELQDEWKFRYNHPPSKVHKSMEILSTITTPPLPNKGLTPFALAMPDKYKSDDAVQSYRDYYIGEKQHIAAWRRRGKPEWFFSI
jgi:hypothetical protein